jgi:hypothetical protein
MRKSMKVIKSARPRRVVVNRTVDALNFKRNELDKITEREALRKSLVDEKSKAKALRVAATVDPSAANDWLYEATPAQINEFVAAEGMQAFFKLDYRDRLTMVYGNGVPTFLLHKLVSYAQAIGLRADDYMARAMPLEILLQYPEFFIIQMPYRDTIADTGAEAIGKHNRLTRELLLSLDKCYWDMANILELQLLTEQELLEHMDLLTTMKGCLSKGIKALYSKEFWFKVFMAME